MATRRTELDIRTKGGDATKRTLRETGDTGSRAFDRIRRSSGPANRGLQLLSRTSQRLQRTFRDLAGPRGLTALTAAGTGFGLLATRALNAAESIADVSDRTGVGIERLQELRFAFDQNGVSVEQLDAGLRRFRRRLDLARDGTGAATDTLEKMNVSLEQDTGAALDEVIRKLGEMARTQDITGEASQLFGEDAGPAMAVLLRQGTREIDAYGERLRELGGIMSDDMVESAAKASAELRTLRRVTGTAFQKGLIEGFIGEFDTFADAIGSQEFQQGVQAWGRMLGETASFVTRHGEDVIRVMGAIAGARGGAAVGGALGTMVGRPGMGRLAGGAVGGTIGALAPELVGVGVSDMDALQDRAESLESRLERIRENIQRPGVQGTPTLLEELKSEAAEVEAALIAVRDRIDQLRSGSGGTSESTDRGRASSTSDLPAALRDPLAVGVAVGARFPEFSPRPIPPKPGEKPDVFIPSELPPTPDQLPDFNTLTGANIQTPPAGVREFREELERTGAAIRRSVMTPTERYNEELARLNDLQQAGIIDTETFSRAVADLGLRFDQTESGAGRLSGAARDLGLTFESAFEDAVIAGEGLRGVLQGLAADLQRVALRRLVTEPAGDFLSDAIGGLNIFGGGLNLSAGTAALASGADLATAANVDIAANPDVFARGGITDRPAIFGEAGPEAAVPLPDGRRIPVMLQGGGGAPSINVQVVNEGPPLEVERTERSTGPDGRTQLKLIVRGQMKEAVNQGALDREMATNFGVRRQGRR